MDIELKKVATVWPGIRNIFSVPHNMREYNKLVCFLDDLMDEVGEDEHHPLASLMETIGSLVEMYESRNISKMKGDPIETLKFLIEEHGLKQGDLIGIGSQGVVSEILSGKRQLNIRQVKLLSEQFNVSPAVFV
ncbi:MAG: transcriptional regulator [Desulfobacterium sp.]|nr:transcriptional regulator [Desulfobacterium sp.]